MDVLFGSREVHIVSFDECIIDYRFYSQQWKIRLIVVKGKFTPKVPPISKLNTQLK